MARGFRDDDREPELVTIENVRAVAASSLALCVQIGDDVEWIPESQIHADSEVFEVGHFGTLVITRWIAEKKGLV